VATIRHTGSGEFVVQAGQVTLITNESGPYDGTVVIPQGTTSLGITADGDWTIEVNAPGAARTFSGDATGNRPDVLLYTGPGGAVAVTPDDLVLKVFDADGNQSDVVNGGELTEGSLVQFDAAPWSISVG
jgi:hypothetical protein